MVYCLNCGSYNSDGSKFCTECGNSLGTISNNTQQNNTQQKSSTSFKKSNNKNLKYICIIGVIIFLLAVAFLGGNKGEIKELQIENTHMYCQVKLPSNVHDITSCEVLVIDENNDIYSWHNYPGYKYISDDIIEINKTFYKDEGLAKPKEIMFTYGYRKNKRDFLSEDFESVKYDIKDSQVISY